MLNRRTLRIKAMQSIFAYEQCKEANYHLALEDIANAFLPDLTSMEVQDKKLLKESGKEGEKLFKELYKPFNLKLAKEWEKRAVEDKKAQEANPQVEEEEEAEDLAKMKSLFLITLTLMSW